MAITQNPITGRTKKKFGTAVFSKQFGKNTMRTKPMDVKNPKTPKQLDQRQKFAIMVELARLLMGFIRVTFKQASIGMSEFNAFVKSNISTAITGAFPYYTIDYSKLIVSKGVLTGSIDGAASASSGSIVDITWTDNSGNGDAQATDYAVLLLINEGKKSIAQEVSSNTRADASLSVTVPSSWEGSNVHVYLSFKDADSFRIADSSYLGSVTILA